MSYILGPEKVHKMSLLTIPLLRNIGLNYFFTYFILNIGVNGHNPITYIQTPFSTIVFQTIDGENAYSFSYFFCVSKMIQLLKGGNGDELYNLPKIKTQRERGG